MLSWASDDSSNNSSNESSEELEDTKQFKDYVRRYTPAFLLSLDPQRNSAVYNRTPTLQSAPNLASPTENRNWENKLQKHYDTKKDKQRLGRWFPGGSVTVTKKVKKELDADKAQRNRKK